MKFTIRNISACIIANIKILRGGPSRVIERCKKGELILSMYTHNMSSHQLKSNIHWLQKKGISFIHVDDLEKIICEHALFPKGKAIITMDDGWNNNTSIMYMAEKMKIPICIFLTTGPMEAGDGYWWSYIKKGRRLGLNIKPVEWYKNLPNEKRLEYIDELKHLVKMKREALKPSVIESFKHSSWVLFGAHTISHPILPKCDDTTMKMEISDSGNTIEKWIGTPVQYFAYPNGSFGEREIKTLKENKYKLAFTTKARPIFKEETDPFKIPRCEMLESVSLAENICRMTGTWIKQG